MELQKYSLEMYIGLLHDVAQKQEINAEVLVGINLRFLEYIRTNFAFHRHSKLAQRIISEIRNKSDYSPTIKLAFSDDIFLMRDSKLLFEGYKTWLVNSKLSGAMIGNWIGSIGDKIEISVEVMLSKGFENNFGDEKSTSYFIKAKDENGNIFIWFSKKELSGRIKISAKIKKHSSFENEKQNEIFYVKIIS